DLQGEPAAVDLIFPARTAELFLAVVKARAVRIELRRLARHQRPRFRGLAFAAAWSCGLPNGERAGRPTRRGYSAGVAWSFRTSTRRVSTSEPASSITS